ncbi:putative acidic fibroblast growth factor intracellular-binding protein [Paratrimastix pyriformis]|uniref:Acidic fibroblast growth factor intracellular-binding protein n=1 Tax=Paratrimastix pyriformis TaxID=342808 RepID=A0ABQ8USI7_9EUKA|nr:putative acidic fibroblast growth factor intracellular-binding protein [Paratrimastix pyriformis]
MITVVSHPHLVDFSIFRLWNDGADEVQALNDRLRHENQPEWESARIEAALRCEISDQYRLFTNMERFFDEPQLFSTQPLFPLDPQTEATLIEAYYEFNEDVFRELLGKKLTARLRRDLEGISTKTRVSLRSCQRQFDNLSRICRIVEELTAPVPGQDPCSIAVALKARMHFSAELANKYTQVALICDHRYETFKRKSLAQAPFGAYSECAREMIRMWSSYGSIDPDEALVEKLHEIKTLLHSDREALDVFCVLSTEKIRGLVDVPTATKIAKVKLPSLVKTLLSIGVALSQPKDHRDFFVEIADRLGDPFRRAPLAPSEVLILLDAVTIAFQAVPAVQRCTEREQAALQERIRQQAALAAIQQTQLQCAAPISPLADSALAVLKTPKPPRFISMVSAWLKYLSVMKHCLSLLYPFILSSP